MAGVLVCVDVVKNHHGVPVETSGHRLSRRSVDDVKQGLGQKRGSVWLVCRSAFCQRRVWGGGTYDVVLVELEAASPGDTSEVGRGQFDDVQFERLLHEHDVVLGHSEAVEVAWKQGGAKWDGADLLNLPQRRFVTAFIRNKRIGSFSFVVQNYKTPLTKSSSVFGPKKQAKKEKSSTKKKPG